MPAAFELKSAALTLIALVLKSPDLAALAQDLIERFGQDSNPFDQEPVAIDLSPVRDSGAAIHFDALIALLRQHRMVPIAVKGGSAEQMAAAFAAGLTEASAGPPQAGRSPSGGPARSDVGGEMSPEGVSAPTPPV